ncbi:pyocin knob domain-containing protein [Pontibaca salina]|uniref:Uncharacterized protein n=1 Tax=Pontibaca salina TaxID=2795731 RepID=A0A934LYV1_9RHOB|nr:pyocin knob domain-containing protein [Pontibaca salina]MBI6628315.1 hypothetical protein [Pontibaca salina]
MTIPITGMPPVPQFTDPVNFNTQALNMFDWIVNDLTAQLNNVDPNDFFSVQASLTDTTPGRLMAVGAFGLGETGSASLLANIDDPNMAAGAYYFDATTAGTKPTGYTGGAVIVGRGGSGEFFQIAVHTQSGSVLTWRTYDSGWRPWRKVMSDADKATPAEAQAGTRDDVWMTPAMVAGVASGVGQSWQDVTASRSVDTDYVNTTGRTIVVSVIRGVPSSGSLKILVNGFRVTEIGRTSGSGGMTFPVRAEVPPGDTYRVEGSNINAWAELIL